MFTAFADSLRNVFHTLSAFEWMDPSRNRAAQTPQKTWADLPVEVKFNIFQLCPVASWPSLMLVDISSFNIVNSMISTTFKNYLFASDKLNNLYMPYNPNKPYALSESIKNLHPLFLSKEARKAVVKDPIYKKYMSADCLSTLKIQNPVKAGNIILFRYKKSIFGSKKIARLALKDLPDLRLADAQTIYKIIYNQVTLNRTMRNINHTFYLSRQLSNFLIENLPILLTQEKIPNIEPIIDLSAWVINSGFMEACQNYLLSVRYNLPFNHIHAKLSIIIKMLETNIFVDDRMYQGKKHPIFLAVSSKNVELLRRFIQAGFNINIKNENEESALHIAVTQNAIGIVRLLVENNIHINAIDKKNKTPLHYACQYGHIDIVRYFCINKADLDIKDVDTNTALHYAKQHGHTAVILLLQEEVARRKL